LGALDLRRRAVGTLQWDGFLDNQKPSSMQWLPHGNQAHIQNNDGKLLFEITIDFIALMMATALAMTTGRSRDSFVVVTVLNTELFLLKGKNSVLFGWSCVCIQAQEF
jgi:hypothetical protein